MTVVKAITQSTPISVAVVVLLLAGAFWSGTTTGALNTRIQSIEKDHSRLEQVSEQLTAISTQLSVLTNDNKRRLDLLESHVRNETLKK